MEVFKRKGYFKGQQVVVAFASRESFSETFKRHGITVGSYTNVDGVFLNSLNSLCGFV